MQLTSLKKAPQFVAVLTSVFYLALTVGCTSAPQPPEVYSGKLSRTLMFPLVDMRADKTPSMASCKPERPMIATSVEMTVRSTFNFAVDRDLTTDITHSDLMQENVEQLKRIPNAGDHYVALLYLEEFGYALGKFKYKLSAYIVRADTGKVVWSRTLDDFAWQGVVGAPMNMAFGMVYFKGLDRPLCTVFRMIVQELFSNAVPLPAY